MSGPSTHLNCDEVRQTVPICVALLELRAHEGETNRVGVPAPDPGSLVGVTTHTSTEMSHTKTGGFG